MGVENQVLADLEREAAGKGSPTASPFSFEHGMPFGLLRVTATGETSARFVSMGPLRFDGHEVLAKGAGFARDGQWVVEELETSLPNARSFAAAVGKEKLQRFQDGLARNLARAALDNEAVFLRRGVVALRMAEQKVDGAIASTEEEIRHREARLANLVARKEGMLVEHAAEEARMRARIAEVEAAAKAASEKVASKPRKPGR